MLLMKYILFTLSLLSLLVACTPTTTASNQEQQVASNLTPIPFEKRWIIVVNDFEVPYNHVHIEGSSQNTNSLADIAKSLADTFSSQAFASQQFRVTERSALATILEELQLGASGLVDANTASKIGEITGAELLALGTINNLTIAKEEKRILGVQSTTLHIYANITVRLVSTRSAELLATANGAAQSNNQSLKVDIHQNFQDILLGSSRGDIHAVLQAAIQQSIQQLVTQLPSK